MSRYLISGLLLGGLSFGALPDQKPHSWSSDLRFEQGIAKYRFNGSTADPNTSYNDTPNLNSTAARFGFIGSVGYKNIFYLQGRAFFSKSLVGNDITAGYYNLSTKAFFFDGDLSLYFPIQLVKNRPLTLQPALGGAIHRFYEQFKLAPSDGGGTKNLQTVRFLAPFVGLYFHLNLFDRGYVKFGSAYHFPTCKIRAIPNGLLLSSYSNYMGASRTLQGKRHGLSGMFDFEYAMSSWVFLTGTFEAFLYETSGGWEAAYELPSGGESAQYLRASAFTWGVKLAF